MSKPLPVFSKVGVPAAEEGPALSFLQARFPHIAREQWVQRIRQGLVQDANGRVLKETDSLKGISHVLYQRAVANEAPIPFEAHILFQNAHFLVADKPHFLPVMPAGQYVQETLLYRLQQETGIASLTPMHRIDRDTAGLVLFVIDADSRNAYHELFRERKIHKSYEAIAPFDDRFLTPQIHSSCLARHPSHFFLMQEKVGDINSHSRIQIVERLGEKYARYRLEPISGKHHQLRVHMAALGIPIVNDPYYPVLEAVNPPAYTKPLQLLAKQLSFVDPITKKSFTFTSQLHLHSASNSAH